jgi:hypothetical protein
MPPKAQYKNIGTETTCSIHRLDYGLGNWNSIPSRGRRFFFAAESRGALGGHPDTYSLGNEKFFFPEVKRPERESDKLIFT